MAVDRDRDAQMLSKLEEKRVICLLILTLPLLMERKVMASHEDIIHDKVACDKRCKTGA